MRRCGNKLHSGNEDHPGEKWGIHDVDHEIFLQIRVHNPKILICSQATRFGFHVTTMMGRNPSKRGTQNDAHG